MGNYYSIGAVDISNSDWTVTKYHDQAVKAAKLGGTTKFMVVAITANNHLVLPEHYGTHAEATGRYDQLASNPGNIAYVAVFDKEDGNGQPFDEAYFVATNDRTERFSHTKSNLAGLVIGVLGGGLALIAATSKKGRK